MPGIDLEELDLMQLPGLTPEQQGNYDELTAQLLTLLDSEPPCIGDGNIDGLVNEQDEADWGNFAVLSLGESSWYDINLDGLTDASDLAIIEFNQGTECSANPLGAVD